MEENPLTRYFPQLTQEQTDQFAALEPLYESWNQKVNLISRSDIQNLREHHVLHSLGVAKVIRFLPGARVIDVGTGGGFPGIPLAIMFPQTEFLLVDSIGKKINVVKDIARELQLGNVKAANERIETMRVQGDFVVSRAVTTLRELWGWTKHLIVRASKHELQNGLLCLKGGALESELIQLKRPHHLYSLSDYFKEEFFSAKKLVHVPVDSR